MYGYVGKKKVLWQAIWCIGSGKPTKRLLLKSEQDTKGRNEKWDNGEKTCK